MTAHARLEIAASLVVENIVFSYLFLGFCQFCPWFFLEVSSGETMINMNPGIPRIKPMITLIYNSNVMPVNGSPIPWG